MDLQELNERILRWKQRQGSEKTLDEPMLTPRPAAVPVSKKPAVRVSIPVNAGPSVRKETPREADDLSDTGPIPHGTKMAKSEQDASDIEEIGDDDLQADDSSDAELESESTSDDILSIEKALSVQSENAHLEDEDTADIDISAAQELPSKGFAQK